MLSTMIMLGLAAHAIAELQPYQPNLARMSTSDVFGLDRRAGRAGYSPGEQLCGVGDTCAEACGKGFTQCHSEDSFTHCYNPSAKQQCCPGGTGDSCDSGYYCSADDQGKTWCCPDSLSLAGCAAKFGTGPLSSQGAISSTTHETTSKPSTKVKTKTTEAEPTSPRHQTSTTSKPSTKTHETETEKVPSLQSTITITSTQSASSPVATETPTTSITDQITTAPGPTTTAPASAGPPASTSILSAGGAQVTLHSLGALVAGAVAALVF